MDANEGQHLTGKVELWRQQNSPLMSHSYVQVTNQDGSLSAFDQNNPKKKPPPKNTSNSQLCLLCSKCVFKVQSLPSCPKCVFVMFKVCSWCFAGSVISDRLQKRPLPPLFLQHLIRSLACYLNTPDAHLDLHFNAGKHVHSDTFAQHDCHVSRRDLHSTPNLRQSWQTLEFFFFCVQLREEKGNEC